MLSNNKNTITKDLDNLGLFDEIIVRRVVKYIQLRNAIFLLLGGIIGVSLFILLLSMAVR